MDCCRDFCWCRCPCFSVLACNEIVPLNVMSHVHVHVLRVASLMAGVGASYHNFGSEICA